MYISKIETFKELPSTNLYIKENLSDKLIGTLLCAETQSNGYGRHKRTWFDSINGMAASFLLKISNYENIHLLPLLIGYSVSKTLNRFNINSMIKWPNDVIVNNKKISGILVESKTINNSIYVIIGVGLNINQTEFDKEISSKATSMKQASNKEYAKKQVINTCIEEVNKALQKFTNDDLSFIDYINQKNILFNKEVCLEDTNTSGTAKSINKDGSISIEIDGKIQQFYGSELTLNNSYEDR